MSALNATIVRCRNWADDPDTCGQDCGVDVPMELHADGGWIRYVMDAGWFVVLRGRDGHGHADPYCSTTCFLAFVERHPELRR